jgi:hypothetical protein
VGVRAVIVVRDHSGRERRFWAAWASKQYQIPHLARFVQTADRDGIPLSVAGYLAYVATHPGTLPAHDITDDGGYGNPDEVGDLDHRYELLLCQPDRTFRYLVRDRDRYQDKPGWRSSEDLGTRAQLYEAAARMCRELAANIQRYANRNNGVVPPGWPSAQDWRDDEHQFTQWRDMTDPQLMDRPGPAVEPVPQWYALRAARAQSRQINMRLRQEYSDAGIRTRVSGDGIVSLTVPAGLATDAQAARIAQTVGAVCGRTFTVSVRHHRPSRYSIHSAHRDSEPRVNATLTLRPQDRGAAPHAAQHRADGDHTGQ